MLQLDEVGLITFDLVKYYQERMKRGCTIEEAIADTFELLADPHFQVKFTEDPLGMKKTLRIMRVFLNWVERFD